MCVNRAEPHRFLNPLCILIQHTLKLVDEYLQILLFHFFIQNVSFVLREVVLAQIKILDLGDFGQDYFIKEALEAVIIDEVHSQSQSLERTATFGNSLGYSF